MFVTRAGRSAIRAGVPTKDFHLHSRDQSRFFNSSKGTAALNETEALQKKSRSTQVVYSKSEWSTIPNLITMTRMASSPLLAYAIVHDQKKIALIGCCVAAFSDWLDGYIAKNYDQSTVLGGLIDPIADKIFIGSLTAGMAFKGLLPFELAVLILGRDLVLLGGTFALRYFERPEGSPYFDTTYSATFEIIPSDLSKANTVTQFLLLSTTLVQFGMDLSTIQFIIEPLWWITGTTTLGSFVGYMDGSAIKRLSNAGVNRGIKDKDWNN